MEHLQPLRPAPERQAPEIPSLENAHDSSPDSPAPRFPPTTGLLRDCVWDTLSLSGSFAQGASVWVDTHLAACWGAFQKQRQEGGAMFALFLSALLAPASPEMPYHAHVRSGFCAWCRGFWNCLPGDSSRSPGTGGQRGLPLQSHRPVYECVSLSHINFTSMFIDIII